jgi:adenylate kinase family enzyme
MEEGIMLKRIMVIGVSPGVGKSTFAANLGENIGIHVYHLDSYFWKSGWIESTLPEFISAQNDMVAGEQWIIEGNYSKTMHIRTEKADTIIYLELPLRVCLYRVIKRWIINIGNTRPDMAEGCPEKLDWTFLKFILTTYRTRKRKMNERYNTKKLTKESQVFIVLKNKKDIKDFLSGTKQHISGAAL